MQMPYMDGSAVILKGLERAQDDRLYELYVACYPSFSQETYISWGDFKKSAKRPQKLPVHRDSGAILNDVKSIISNISFKKGE